MKKQFAPFRSGFTLIEILVAVLIVSILVTAAVPIYEKTIEKSRIAEARTMLKKILESKLRIMDSMDLATFNDDFGFEHLDIQLACEGGCQGSSARTKDFTYTLSPGWYPMAVCAARNSGSNEGVNFLFLGELAGSVYSETQKFICGSGNCEAYSMTQSGRTYCTP